MYRRNKQQAHIYNSAYGGSGTDPWGSADFGGLFEGTGIDHGFYQEKYSTLYTISFWDRLDGA